MPFGGGRLDRLSGPGARELRERPARRPRRRGDPRARLPDRRRLRLLGRQLRAAARARPARSRGGRPRTRSSRTSAPAPARFGATIDYAQRLVEAVNADFGAVFDRSAERLFLIDETRPRGAARPGAPALPASARATERQRERSPSRSRRRARSRRWSATGSRSCARRRRSQELTQAAAGEGVVFAGAPGGGYVFPRFLPAYDAIASLCKLLELLAPVERAAVEARRRAAAARR